jgi:hypothetical protein
MLPSKQIFAATLLLALTGCNSHYPEGMSRAERKKYYDEYDKVYTEKSFLLLQQSMTQCRKGVY